MKKANKTTKSKKSNNLHFSSMLYIRKKRKGKSFEPTHSDIKKSYDTLRRFNEAENMRFVINIYFQNIFKTIENPSWRWWKFWVKKGE